MHVSAAHEKHSRQNTISEEQPAGHWQNDSPAPADSESQLSLPDVAHSPHVLAEPHGEVQLAVDVLRWASFRPFFDLAKKQTSEKSRP